MNNKGQSERKTRRRLPDLIKREVSYPREMYEELQQRSDETGISVVEQVRRAISAAINDDNPKPDHYVPLYGLIAGGVAMEVVPDLPGAFIQPPFDDLPENCYALKVRGKSMQAEMGISAPDGYYALFAPGVIFPNMIVHVEFVDKDGDVHKATLKKYIPHGDGTVEFRPLNRKYKPIVKKEGEFKIKGGFIRAWDGISKE